MLASQMFDTCLTLLLVVQLAIGGVRILRDAKSNRILFVRPCESRKLHVVHIYTVTRERSLSGAQAHISPV